MSVWITGLVVGGSGVLGAAASDRAADTAADASDDASRTQLQMYQQNRADMAPYREVGNQALNAYARAMGLAGSTATSQDVIGQNAFLDRNRQYGGLEGFQDATQGLSPISGATWRGRPIFTDGQGGIFSVRGRDATVGSAGVEYLGQAGEGGRGLKFDGTGVKSASGMLAYRDGQFYDGRGPRANTIAVREPVTIENQADQPAGQATAQPAAQPNAMTGDDRYGGFYASPGYQFRQDEAARMVDQNAAARGRYMSGAREKALTRYSQGIASAEFGDYMNRLAAASGLGQTATNNSAILGANAASSVANNQINAGAARASGYLGVANTLNNTANNYLAYRGLSSPGNNVATPYGQAPAGGQYYPGNPILGR
jgi:hypothetical protein